MIEFNANGTMFINTIPNYDIKIHSNVVYDKYILLFRTIEHHLLISNLNLYVPL